MNEKTLAVIALQAGPWPSLADKLTDAVRWLELAAAQGADLAVLPESINDYGGDGPDHPERLSLDEALLGPDWSGAAAPLLDAARRLGLAVTVPVTHRLTDGPARYVNRFYLVDEAGEIAGHYQKMCPTPGELEAGAVPGDVSLIEWQGLAVGGAICFDTNFPWVFEHQARAGADLFLAPSLWPGGRALDYYALHHETPIALAYPAWSRILDAAGREVAAVGDRHETLRFGFGSRVALATINFDRITLHADGNQKRIVDVQRHYGAAVRVTFSQPDCLFFLESRDPELTVDQVVEAFELVPRDRYFDDAQRRCAEKGETGIGEQHDDPG